MAFQPSPHIGMFVSSIIINDEMKWDLTWKLLIEGAEEAEELLMPMPLIALADHLALQHLQRGEQSRGAVPLVIVGHGPTTSFFEGQAWLCPIQRLNLALLVHAQHDRPLRRIQVQPHHIR